MAGRYDRNPLDEEEEVNPFANPENVPAGSGYDSTRHIPLDRPGSGTQDLKKKEKELQAKQAEPREQNPESVPAASNSTLSPLPLEPAGSGYDSTRDIPLDRPGSGTQDLKEKENELQTKEAEPREQDLKRKEDAAASVCPPRVITHPTLMNSRDSSRKRERGEASGSVTALGKDVKKHASSVQALNDDVIELILQRLPVQSLMRFKCVAKSLKATTERRGFHKEHLNCRMLSRGVDILFVVDDDDDEEDQSINFHGSIISAVKFPFSSSMVCHNSCDGLLLIHNVNDHSYVINPATKWYRGFSLSNYQRLFLTNKGDYDFSFPQLGFGKDKSTGVYKPVWLYNSTDSKAKDVTTCELFDFSTNLWKFVVPASPSRVLPYQKPVYLGDHLYWLTENTEVLAFNLQSETFSILCETPLAPLLDPRHVRLSVLNDQLCVSEKIWPTQEIWALDSNTWSMICSIDLNQTFHWFEDPDYALDAVAILEKTKLVLHGNGYLEPLVVYDLETGIYELLFTPTTAGTCVSYFQSLFSV